MKPEELRIGNFVNHSELGIVEVIAVGKDYIHCTFNGETFYESIGRFSPIPLNEEWLLKFGFEKKNWGVTVYYYKGFELDSVFYMKEIDWGLKFEYVDQLQNAFHILAKEELQIKKDG